MMKTISNNILMADKLKVGYFKHKKNLTIVENININLKKPIFVSILGKNGTGKSTLLRTLAQLQPALGGTIYLDKKNAKNLTANEIAQKLSVVLTETEKSTQFTVFQMVAFGRSVYTNWLDQLSETDMNMIEKALTWTGIQHLRDKKIQELSDGQRQKVLLARALAQDTPIILLDEPTVHLDVHQSMEMFCLFRKWVDDYQKTIILSTHEIGLATQMSDEIWIIDQGKIWQEATEEILKNDRIDQFFNTDYIRFNKNNHSFEYLKTQ